MSSWSDITLESAACILILVMAYKVYRMRMTAESECCGGAVNLSAHNPGNKTPRILKEAIGIRETIEESRDRIDEEVGLTLEEIDQIKKSRLVRSTNEVNSSL